jgi:glycosyltransferase involved in cell wall biosynthesis
VQKPRIVLVHNRYRHAGGEDEVFEAEAALLESRGHSVERFTLDNRDLREHNPIAMAAATVWNTRTYRALRQICRRTQASVVHFHNTFPMVSPAAYYAARAEGAAVVQTLHNFRLICLNALCYREGHPCEQCVTKTVRWPGVVHGCYRNSRSASGVTAVMLSLHAAARTWTEHVDTYVALSEFARSRFISGGLPSGRIVVKPNFLVDDPGVGNHEGGHVLYVGRLSPEKGIDLLMRAWSVLGERIPLKVIGSGPMEHVVGGVPGVEWLGPLPRGRVLALMQRASVLVFPSEVYENCPMTLIQAFATALPVVASGHGSIAEMVCDGVAGWHFAPGDVNDFIRAVKEAIQNAEQRKSRGCEARRRFEARYTKDENYRQLSAVYASALQRLGAVA